MSTTTASAPPAIAHRMELRAGLATAMRLGAFVALNGAIVISPFSARFVLESRPLPFVFWDYRDLLLFWNQILILTALGLWAVSLALQPRRLYAGPPLVWVPVAVLAIAIGASVPFAVDVTLAAYNASILLGFVVFAVFVANEVRSSHQLVPAIAAMIVIQAVVAIAQSLSQSSIGLSALGELSLDPNVPGVSILWTQSEGLLLRAYGLSDHPNILGGVLAASMLVLAAGFARQRDEVLALACGVFAVGAAALFVTFSRAAALGLAGGILVALLLLLMRRDWRTLRFWLAACVLAAIVCLPLARTYAPYVESRATPRAQPVGSPEERSLTEREALARQTVEVFRDNPIVGVGPGVLPTALAKAYPDFEWHYFPAHVAILVVAAETGIVGASAYGVLTIAPWLLLWQRRRHLTPELIGVSGALLALQIVGLLDYYTWSLNAGRIWFWLVLGLWVAAYSNAGGERREAR